LIICGEKYRKELILNVSVLVFEVLWRAIWRGTDTEWYCVCCEDQGRAIYRRIDTEYYRILLKYIHLIAPICDTNILFTH